MNTTIHSSNLNSESEFFSIKLPEYRKAKLELWSFIPLNDLEALLACLHTNKFLHTNENKQQQKLTEYKKFSNLLCLQLNLNEQSKKDQILIDQYYYIARFGMSNNFTDEQIDCLLLILKRTHEMAIETSFGNMDETFDYFKKLLVIHAVHRPPYSIDMFTMNEITLITNYALDTYFKQFKFYKYVFSLAVRLDLKFKYSHLPADTAAAVVDTSVVKDEAENFLTDMSNENKLDSELPVEASTQRDDTELEGESLKGSKELKDFIRSYLGDKLKRMKDELSDELNPRPSEKSGSKKK